MLIGIDVGTSNSKAALVSMDGRILRIARAATPWRPTATGPETDPESLVESVRYALDELVSPGLPGPVAAVGVTSLAETGVLIDRSDRPVAPAISWADRRGDTELHDLLDAIGSERFSAVTGVIPHLRLSVVKYWWLLRNLESAATGVRWLDVAGWIVHRLGGQQVAERSLAGRTGFMQLDGPGWWDEPMELTGAPEGIMAPLVGSGSAAGEVALGMDGLDGATLTVAGHDHLVASAGAGATRPDDLFVSCGTAEAYLRSVSAPAADGLVRAATGAGACVGWHVLPGRQSMLIGHPAGRMLKRALSLLGAADPSGLESDHDGQRGSGDPLEFVGLDGDRASLTGIGWTTPPGDVWAAAVAATQPGSVRLRNLTETLLGPPARTIAAGGWTESTEFMASRRAVWRDVTVSPVREAGVRGAALAAGVAAGCLDWDAWTDDPGDYPG